MLPLNTLGLTPTVTAHLNKMGIRTVFDLVLHLPLRYDDETRVVTIDHLTLGVSACVEAEVVSADIQYRPRRMLLVRVRDTTGEITLRFLNFYGSQVKQLAAGTKLRLLGELRQGYLGPEMIHPKYRLLTTDVPLADSLTPIYPTTAGLSQTSLRRAIEKALTAANLTDTLNDAVRQYLNLAPFEESVRLLHNPPANISHASLEHRKHPAWQRLKFDELLAQQISMRLHINERESRKAPPLLGPGQRQKQFLSGLPFKLTRAQKRVFQEIESDLARSFPMHRLLQGDVGSGKTVVAALACLRAIDAGFQATLMAPTEILAEQHFRKIEQLLLPLGLTTTWLTGRLRKSVRATALEHIASGRAQLVIGTHALIQESVRFSKLGLVIIDEQHRFGVEQRLALRNKALSAGGRHPHQLMMSATPIPRTLSMSYFADLDVSIIDELPQGRIPILTKLIDDSRRDEVISRIRESCEQGGQAYWVCPLIEESEALQLRTALETFDRISSIFPDLSVGLIHGRLSADEKATAMHDFAEGRLQVLVATTVIEVGVDVANASVMVIEHAERMGLAQLHQLRGRVGRGSAQGYCVLLYHPPLSETARVRLKVIFENTDGFEIARQDLLMRGPGEYLGARQSGAALLRFADIEEDESLMNAAHLVALQWIAKDPAGAQSHLQRWLFSRQEFLTA